MRTTTATLLAVLALATTHAAAQPATLRSGEATLDWVGDPTAGFTPRFTLNAAVYAAPSAGVLFVLARDADDRAARYDVPARSVAADGKTVNSVATLTTPGGSVLEVRDAWSAGPQPETFRLERTVAVRSVGTDQAFGSGFELALADAIRQPDQVDVFIPGLWYATPADTKSSSLIHDVGQDDFLLREDRMPLPLVSARDRRSGAAISIAHRDVDGATIRADDRLKRLVDARLAFGSLGLRRSADAPLRLAFCYPGTEGEQTGIYGFKPDRRTVERLHPLAADQPHTYSLTIRLSRDGTFADQMKAAWRAAYADAAPKPVDVKPDAVYRASVDVLKHFAYDQGDVAGIPFSATLPEGEVRDRSLQMGFVGQQLPCASYLIDDGLRGDRPDLLAQGERITDFWARESFSPAGVPRTWFNLEPNPHFRNYNTFLRVATDGTSGMLRAWQISRAAGRDKPAWLAFCRRVGDWLISIQQPDGSFFREYRFQDGKPASDSKTSTLHPVRLLVDLWCATNDPRYRAAAIRAADWSLRANRDARSYVGGTPDNPDVLDKEAGWIAFDSYLALYDVTRQQRWLDAAVDAATFTETWMYAWNVPMPIDARDLGIPRVQTTAGGASLIATGHSGADVFLAYASLSYARLALYTGDEHFADVARLLQANTAQFVDVDGTYGYAHPGLCVEAFSLAVNRGHSVRVWLPWGTSAILEPMSRSREIFGTLDVRAALALDPADRDQRHTNWARRRGFDAPARR